MARFALRPARPRRATDTVNGKYLQFAYDGGGQRIKFLKKNSSNQLQDSSRIYILNGGKIVAEYLRVSGNFQIDHYNIYGNSHLGKLTYASNQRFYNIPDHLGSTRVTLTETGTVDSWSDFYPFGKESRGSSSVNEPKEQFTGKERDVESGLDYFGARYYSADVGRWLSKDPMAEKYMFSSSYVYGLNNPIKLIDPDGKYVVDASGLQVSRVTKADVTIHMAVGSIPFGGLLALFVKFGMNDPSYKVGPMDFVGVIVPKSIGWLGQRVPGGLKSMEALLETSFTAKDAFSIDDLEVDNTVFKAAAALGYGKESKKGIFEINTGVFGEGLSKKRFESVSKAFKNLREQIVSIAKDKDLDLSDSDTVNEVIQIIMKQQKEQQKKKSESTPKDNHDKQQ